MLKVSEEDRSLLLQVFLHFVRVIGSSVLEGNAAEGGVGFVNDQ